MAKISLGGFNAGEGLSFEHLTSEKLSKIMDYDSESFKKTSIYLSDDSKNFMSFSGSGLQYKMQGGEVMGITAGSLDSFKVVSDGNSVISATDLDLSGKALSAAIDSGSTMKFINTILSGDDQITGTKWADLFWGAGGNDKLVGGAGNDELDGDAGNDKLYGGSGKDWLSGGTGKDLLDGGLGIDYMRGQDGSDTFVFSTKYGADTITDFDAVGSDHDVIDLSGLKSVTSFADLKAHHLSVDGADILIDGGNGDTLLLQNVKLKTLDADDFQF